MFGLEYLLALSKVAFQIAFAIVSAIPFSISWNCIAPIYMAQWLPVIFLNIPFWHFVAIILVFSFIGEQVQKITPRFISIDNNSK